MIKENSITKHESIIIQKTLIILSTVHYVQVTFLSKGIFVIVVTACISVLCGLQTRNI